MLVISQHGTELTDTEVLWGQMWCVAWRREHASGDNYWINDSLGPRVILENCAPRLIKSLLGTVSEATPGIWAEVRDLLCSTRVSQSSNYANIRITANAQFYTFKSCPSVRFPFDWGHFCLLVSPKSNIFWKHWKISNSAVRLFQPVSKCKCTHFNIFFTFWCRNMH